MSWKLCYNLGTKNRIIAKIWSIIIGTSLIMSTDQSFQTVFTDYISLSNHENIMIIVTF